ncbi:MAG: hypothetical protein IJR39_12235 [Treponema sp.]|nr:hypothetical protein [Treponema sp.]
MNTDGIFSIILSIMLALILIFVVVPRARQEKLNEDKYLFEITVDNVSYILDKKRNNITYTNTWRAGQRISFELDDGTYITSSTFKIKKIPKTQHENQKSGRAD